MKVLIVIDMQNDFIDGALGTPEARAIVPNVKAKIKAYDNGEDMVFFTRDTHYDSYLRTSEGKHLPVPHCIAATDGWKIHEEIENEKFPHVNKPTFGYMGWTTRFPTFDKIESIELVGLCTDICVVSNALILKAMYPEVEITVDASCCAGVTPESHKAALLTMKMCQINVIGE